MRAVYKYKYKDDMQLPPDYIVRKIGVQDGELYVWAEIDPERPTSTVDTGFMLVPTGTQFSEEEDRAVHFVETVFHDQYVWHIYQRFEHPEKQHD